MTILASENLLSLRCTKKGILLSTSIFIPMTCAKVKCHPPLHELDELRLSVTCSGLYSGAQMAIWGHMELSFMLWWCFETPKVLKGSQELPVQQWRSSECFPHLSECKTWKDHTCKAVRVQAAPVTAG